VDRVVARADEDDAVLVERVDEPELLGEEAVAGVHGLRAGLLARVHDVVHVQVALARGGRALGTTQTSQIWQAVRRGKQVPYDADGLVGELDVLAVGVGRAVHRDRLDAHLLAGPHDAAGDLPAVGDEDLLKRLLNIT
jgi:hypothetical protein